MMKYCNESLQKWRQIEHCVFELRTTKNVSGGNDQFEINVIII
jgi:hypothetical protein